MESPKHVSVEPPVDDLLTLFISYTTAKQIERQFHYRHLRALVGAAAQLATQTEPGISG